MTSFKNKKDKNREDETETSGSTSRKEDSSETANQKNGPQASYSGSSAGTAESSEESQNQDQQQPNERTWDSLSSEDRQMHGHQYSQQGQPWGEGNFSQGSYDPRNQSWSRERGYDRERNQQYGDRYRNQGGYPYQEDYRRGGNEQGPGSNQYRGQGDYERNQDYEGRSRWNRDRGQEGTRRGDDYGTQRYQGGRNQAGYYSDYENPPFERQEFSGHYDDRDRSYGSGNRYNERHDYSSQGSEYSGYGSYGQGGGYGNQDARYGGNGNWEQGGRENESWYGSGRGYRGGDRGLGSGFDNSNFYRNEQPPYGRSRHADQSYGSNDNSRGRRAYEDDYFRDRYDERADGRRRHEEDEFYEERHHRGPHNRRRY